MPCGRDLLPYYIDLFSCCCRTLKNRAMVMKRFPNAAGEFLFTKRHA
jgi:DNA primase